MIHHLLPHVKVSIILGVTALLDLAAILTSEQISTIFQFGTMAGIVAVAVLNRLDARKSLAVSTRTAQTTEKIHVLSNSAMEAQMRIVWLQAKRIAELTKAKEDFEIADEAHRAYMEHKIKQKAVDEAMDEAVMGTQP